MSAVEPQSFEGQGLTSSERGQPTPGSSLPPVKHGRPIPRPPSSSSSLTTSSPLASSPPLTSSPMNENSSDEEYFEEFHLPNTGENAFVRHLSFRRKVSKTPIYAPDAERIEGLVRTGEFVRHGSIRKKIVPEEDEFDDSDENIHHDEKSANNLKPDECISLETDDEPTVKKTNDQNKSGNKVKFSDRIENDIKEIERYLSQEHFETEDHGSSLEVIDNSVQKLGPGQAPTSTPMPNRILPEGNSDWTQSPIESVSDQSGPPSLPFMDNQPMFPDEPHYNTPEFNSEPESLSIEQTTLWKLKSCLDFSNIQDIYNLSGRLQDILSQTEIEEFLSNSAKYSEYIDQDVIEALSASLIDGSLLKSVSNHDSESGIVTDIPRNLPEINVENYEGSSNQNEANGVGNNNPDSGFSSPKERKMEERKLIYCNVTANMNETASDSVGDLSSGVSVPDISNCDSSSDVIISHRKDSTESVGENDKYGLRSITLADPNSPSVLKYINVPVDVHDQTVEREVGDVLSDAVRLSHFEQDKPSNGMILPDKIIEDRPPPHSTPILEKQFSNLSQISVATECTEDIQVPFCSLPPPPPDLIPELSATEEYAEERHWRNVVIAGAWRRIDMKVIAPYKKCISHGGYLAVNQNPIIVLSSSLLPDRSRKDYHYVMDNLFMYVLSFLEQLASDDYILIYFAWGKRTNSNPGFQWLRKAYQMIDRRLRKNLKELFVVHPSLWAKTIIALSRPFISSKFYRKLRFIANLVELAQLVSLEQLDIPDSIKQADFELMIQERKRSLK